MADSVQKGESFFAKILFVVVTAVITGLLIPYVSNKIQSDDARNEAKQKNRIEIFDDVSKTLLTFESLLLDVSWFKTPNGNNQELHLKAFQRYQEESVTFKMVRNTMFMLDWGARSIELFPEKHDPGERCAKVDREILKRALQYHRLRLKEKGKSRFTPVEVAIRDNFDHFLFYLQRFEQFIEAGLITQKELKPYLSYWIDVIADKIESDVRNVIFHYIDQYEFHSVQELFKQFGKDIKPTTLLDSTRYVVDDNTGSLTP